jgi:hypothetical protein
VTFMVYAGDPPNKPPLASHGLQNFAALDNPGAQAAANPHTLTDGNIAIPDNCLTCHGAASTYDSNHNVTNAHFLPFDPSSLLFSTTNPTYSKANMLPELQRLNQLVGVTNTTTAIREFLQNLYGGGLNVNSGTVGTNEDAIPTGWLNQVDFPGADQVYTEVVKPYCRTCHLSVDSPSQLDWSQAAPFFGTYGPAIQLDVCGNAQEGFQDPSLYPMPQSERTQNLFWASPARAHLVNALSLPSQCGMGRDAPIGFKKPPSHPYDGGSSSSSTTSSGASSSSSSSTTTSSGGASASSAASSSSTSSGAGGASASSSTGASSTGSTSASSGTTSSGAASSSSTTSSGAAPTPTCMTIERGLLGAVADARLRQDQPDVNGGALTVLNAGYATKPGEIGARRILLRFDLSPIPSAASIVAADLSLISTGSQTSALLDVVRATTSWSEATVTWNSFGMAFDASAPVPFSVNAGYVGPVDVDLTALVTGWYTGALANDGLLVMEQSSANAMALFGSSEDVLAHRPSLKVCFLL